VNPGVLQAAGPAAQSIAGLSWLLFIGGGVIFVGVMLLLAWALRRSDDGSPVRARLWVLGGGVLFPGLVLAALFAYVVPMTPVREAAPADALLVSVTGKMWWWEVRYPAAPGEQELVTANEIRIPVGRTVAISLASDDVIHSFWVPALAGKIDMMPGKRHQLLLSADRAGTFRGQCAEFCGEQHAKMALHVVALPVPEFEAWRQAQLLAAPTETTPQQARGRDAFLANRCDACHTVRGVAESSRLGPDLTHVGSRLHLGAGTLANSPAAIAQWVAHVQQVKAGARMPSYDRLDGATLAALAEWLGSLR
jgi:cytochrome c oxidase subunit 2